MALTVHAALTLAVPWFILPGFAEECEKQSGFFPAHPATLQGLQDLLPTLGS